MSEEFFPVVTEKKARKIIDKGGNVVIIHTRASCPVCDHFLPEVLNVCCFQVKYLVNIIYSANKTVVNSE